jgi:APA family basic amino acid/polyamine antiporter
MRSARRSARAFTSSSVRSSAAGAWAPLSFGLAALVAGLTGASFAEMSGRLPSSGGPVAWADKAFGIRWFAILIGWAIVATAIVSAATIATGFVAYASVFVDWSAWLVVPVLVGLPTLVAAAGIKQSAWFMALITSAGLVGLAIVLWNAGGNIPQWPALASAGGAPGSAAIASGILLGGFLAFYAFIGFEDLAHLGEEVRDARRSVPRAIFFTLGVSLALYLLVSMAALATLPAAQLAESRAPLIDVVRATGWGAGAVAVLSLATIADGLLAQIVMATRTIHDLGKRRGGAPRALAAVSTRTDTPVFATLLCGLAILALALFFPTRTLAATTSAIILSIFAASNCALIVLKRRGPAPKGGFRAWRWIPFAGAASCMALLVAQLVAGEQG